MAIIVNKDGNVVNVENQPEEARAMFPNLQRLFDVQVAGSSVVINGVADIPESGTNVYGAIRVASDYDLRNTTQSNAVVAKDQHKSMFYGMAKAAGDNTQAASANAVGTYTDDAKIAIQKMLGIYEAPWELINSGNFTNSSEGDYTINTDSNVQPLELTDIRLVFWLPSQETASGKGDFGRVECNYTDAQNRSGISVFYFGEWTQEAGAASRGAFGSIEQHKNMVDTWFTKNNRVGADVSVVGQFKPSTPPAIYEFSAAQRIYESVVIKAVTGRGDYVLYGKRK